VLKSAIRNIVETSLAFIYCLHLVVLYGTLGHTCELEDVVRTSSLCTSAATVLVTRLGLGFAAVCWTETLGRWALGDR
jgi:hypothetical protein